MIDNEPGGNDANATTTASKGDVSLHIERLVIDGLPLAANTVTQLQLAVQNELTRLLTQDGLPRANQGATRSVAAPGFQIATDSVPAELGRRIARSVYESLNQDP